MLLLTGKSETTERIEGKYYRQPNTPAYQTMHFGQFTATLNATEPKLFKRVKDLQDAYNDKGYHAPTIKNERAIGPFRYGVTGSFEDGYTEPWIDISCDGRTLHLNGNYKPGMIRSFVKDSLKLM